MTTEERAEIRALHNKIDNLPTELITRLDDRYTLKTHVSALDNRYVTRRESAVVNWILGAAVSLLTLWQSIRGK